MTTRCLSSIVDLGYDEVCSACLFFHNLALESSNLELISGLRTLLGSWSVLVFQRSGGGCWSWTNRLHLESGESLEGGLFLGFKSVERGGNVFNALKSAVSEQDVVETAFYIGGILL
uniref:Uncharacterized protein n=1 Tax=Cacopsylla melanoneura TaxID=428564 RepID=A0A8D8XC58_9HEMI